MVFTEYTGYVSTISNHQGYNTIILYNTEEDHRLFESSEKFNDELIGGEYDRELHRRYEQGIDTRITVTVMSSWQRAIFWDWAEKHETETTTDAESKMKVQLALLQRFFKIARANHFCKQYAYELLRSNNTLTKQMNGSTRLAIWTALDIYFDKGEDAFKDFEKAFHTVELPQTEVVRPNIYGNASTKKVACGA